MPIIANDRVESLVKAGRANVAPMGRKRIEPKPPKKEPRSLALLQSMRDSIKGLADKDQGENTALLQRIELLLQQLITLYSMPRADPAAAPVAVNRKKTNWKFQINRDRNGRLESIEAVPEEGE